MSTFSALAGLVGHLLLCAGLPSATNGFYALSERGSVDGHFVPGCFSEPAAEELLTNEEFSELQLALNLDMGTQTPATANMTSLERALLSGRAATGEAKLKREFVASKVRNSLTLLVTLHAAAVEFRRQGQRALYELNEAVAVNLPIVHLSLASAILICCGVACLALCVANSEHEQILRRWCGW